MTAQQYIEWLDAQIDDNDRRMEDAPDRQRSSYYLGCASAMAKAKEKFLTIDFTTQQPENNFTDGLE